LDEPEQEDVTHESTEHAPGVDMMLVEDLLEQVNSIDLQIAARDCERLS
jgi:hypothetical protein